MEFQRYIGYGLIALSEIFGSALLLTCEPDFIIMFKTHTIFTFATIMAFLVGFLFIVDAIWSAHHE